MCDYCRELLRTVHARRSTVGPIHFVWEVTVDNPIVVAPNNCVQPIPPVAREAYGEGRSDFAVPGYVRLYGRLAGGGVEGVAQMHSITIQTQYMYCTFEWRPSNVPCQRCSPNAQYIYCICMVILYIWGVLTGMWCPRHWPSSAFRRRMRSGAPATCMPSVGYPL